MFKWKLERPLAVFDIEATGSDAWNDRMVELAIVRIHPDQRRDSHVYRINPQRPIPPEVTLIHGISDADVAECPPFEELAPQIFELLDPCDLAGFNLLRFDIPMLEQEFVRAKLRFDGTARKVIDAQRIYHRKEPRTLSAALAFYCNELHLGAHGAEADVLATIRVIEGQLTRYADLPRDIGELSDFCDPRDPAWVDRRGRLLWKDGEVVLNFGKKKGARLRDLVREDPGFIRWMLRSDFPADTVEIVRNATEDRYPDPPQLVEPAEE